MVVYSFLDDQNRKSMARLILSLLILLIGVNIGKSQLTLKASDIVQNVGEEVIIDIEAVKGVDSIAAMQYAMSWDTAILEFVEVVSLWLPPLDDNDISANFGFYNLDKGILPFVWAEPNSDNMSIPDHTVLMQLKFKVIGSGNSSFDFISTSFLQIGFFKQSGDTVAVILNPGSVSTPVSVSTIPEVSTLSISPNPTSEDITISFSYTDPIDLDWSVYNMNGQELHTGFLPKGFKTQTIKIDRDIFPEKGVYLFSARSAQGVLTRKLILQ